MPAPRRGAPARTKPKPPPKPKVQTRLAPEARRRQLLDVAAAVLTEHGIEAVQISTVAERAGVTRPIVYRFFETREALVLAVLEDFADALDAVYREALVRTLGQPVETIARAFVDASCDVVERKGAGPWRMLETRGMGREVGRDGVDLVERFFSPWYERLAEFTGTRRIVVAMQVAGIVAAGRSALDFWIDGHVSREAAVEHATRTVRVLIEEFARGRTERAG